MNQHLAGPIPQQPVMSKGQLFRALSQNVPLNSYHLPDHIYRADMIPQDLLSYSPPDRATTLEAATLNITFDHGYPAFDETTPLWGRLPGETEEAFSTYTLFLELPETSKADNPVRLLPLIAEATGTSLERVSEWCNIYYWHWRARAYDLFLQACHRKQREQRIMSIEGSHFAMAEKMLAQVQDLANRKLQQEIALITENDEAETESKVKDLIDMAVKLASLQRVSVGLPANGPEKLDVSLPRHATVAEAFKSIAKEGAADEATTSRSVEMDTLLANPDELARAQELLIRMTNPQTILPNWKAPKDTVEVFVGDDGEPQ